MQVERLARGQRPPTGVGRAVFHSIRGRPWLFDEAAVWFRTSTKLQDVVHECVYATQAISVGFSGWLIWADATNFLYSMR
jgi:hypothetical protein